MDSTSLYDRFRSEVYDSKEPYLWTDDEVFQYMDAAQKTLVRATGGIADSTSDMTKISVVAGEPWVTLDSKVLTIRRAQLESSGRVLTLLNHENLDSFVDTYDYGLQRGPRITNETGPVRYMVLNMDQDKVRLIAVPAEADTIQLTVYRLPLTSILGIGQAFEVPEQHHEHLLVGMKALAYRKQDAETRNDKAAMMNEAAFTAYCQQVRRERERREHKPRTIAYGGL
jgi:hypothetical protein